MKRFIEGEDRRQATLLPASLEDYVTEDNPVRVVDVFIDELDLEALGFSGVAPEVTGRPAYHPATLLKIYLYGYLNRIQSSRRLERETQRNIELMWLTGRLMPDFKTIADFRRDSGPAIRAACARFVVLCRQFNLFTRTIVAIDGSKFKAVNNRDKNFTVAKVAKRIEQVEASIARYLAVLDRADREDGDMAEAKTIRLKEKIEGLQRQMQALREIGKQVEAAPDKQVSLTDPDARSMATSGKGTGIVGYNVQIAVDAEHHLIVAHDVTNVGSDRAQLTAMSRKAREASGCEEVTVLADIDEPHLALAIRRRLRLREARQSRLVDATELAVEIGGLYVQVRKRLNEAWIFLGPVEPSAGQQLRTAIAELPGQLRQPYLGADALLFLGHRRCPFETPRPGAANPDHSAPGLGFRLSYDTNCQIKS